MTKFTRKQDTHFYLQWKPADWIADPGLRRCSAAAKGVWIDMLMAMFFEETRGVLPGDLKILQRLLPHDEETIRQAVRELHQNGVVSYGKELDAGLGEYDLVNRRMYREYYIARVRSAAGKLGGRPRKVTSPEAEAFAENPEKQTQSKSEANHKQNPKQNESPITIAKAIKKEKYINAEDPKDEDPNTEGPNTEDPGPRARDAVLAEGAYSTHSAEQPFVENLSADLYLSEDLPASSPGTGQAPRAEAVVRQEARLPQTGRPVAAQSMYATLRGNPVGGNAQGGCSQIGDLLPIGGIFGELTLLDDLLGRVYAVAKDGAAWQQWWRKALEIIQKDPDGWCYFVDTLCYVEDCINPQVRAAKDLGVLNAPGKYLVSRLLQWARHHQVRIPALPREVAA